MNTEGLTKTDWEALRKVAKQVKKHGPGALQRVDPDTAYVAQDALRKLQKNNPDFNAWLIFEKVSARLGIK